MTLSQLYVPVAAAYAAALLLQLRRDRRVSFWMLLAAGALHFVFLDVRALWLGSFNPGAIFEEQAFLPFCLAGISLWLWASRRPEEAAAMSRVATALAILSLLIDKGVIPPSPKSGSWLVPLFFFCEILSHALFIGAAVVANLKRRPGHSFPLAHRLAVWGFVLYSIAQVSGAVWCYLGWSVPFQWGFRHLHSAAIWCFFANYIHLRFLPWWSDRRKAVYLAAGALLLVVYLAVLQFIEAGQVRIGG